MTNNSEETIIIKDVNAVIANNALVEIKEMIDNPSDEHDIDTLILRTLKTTVTQMISELQVLEDELTSEEFMLDKPEVYTNYQRTVVTDVLDAVSKVTDAMSDMDD